MGFLIAASLLLFSVSEVEAGFGISPPRVWNDKLVPGSHYEQTITLTRSNPTSPIKIVTELNAPDLEGWITIAEGDGFIYPAGPQQFPMTVIVDVPEDAGYGTYYGKMTIKAAPADTEEGSVSIAVGAVVDFKLTVSGEEFSDFKIRGISIPDTEEGWPLKFIVKLENLGNVKVRPSKVHLDIFDDYRQRKIQSGDILSMSWVESFKVGSSEGKMPVELAAGHYWVDYEVYKNDVLLIKDRLKLRVHPPGTLVPRPLLERIKNYITASPLRLILFTFLGTIILVAVILVLLRFIKKRRRKKGK